MNRQDLNRLRRIISIAEKLIASNPKPKRGRPAGSTNSKEPAKRIRRTGKELAQFRKMLKAQRKRGVSAAELARKNGISSAYIYMLG
jgi:hypothetical protein